MPTEVNEALPKSDFVPFEKVCGPFFDTFAVGSTVTMDRLSAATSAEEFAAALGSMDDDARLSTASDCLRAALAANWAGLDPASLPTPSPWLDEEARRALSLEGGAEGTETSESADTQRKKKRRITAGANRIAIGARATYLLYAAARLLRLAVVEEDLVSAGASGEGEEGTTNESPPSLLLSFRTLLAWQRLLVEPAIQIKEAMENVLSLLEALPPGTLSRDEAIALALERVYAHLAYYEHERARESLDAARALANLRLELTGRMGKRTRYQVKELAQLVLDTGRDSDAETSSTGEGNEKEEGTKMEIESDDTAKNDGEDEGVDLDVPVNCRNEDDTLLQKVTLSTIDSYSSSSRPLSSLDLAIILASCQLEKFFEAEELLLEKCDAYLEEVIGRRRCWSVQASALLMRSQLERRQKRRVERAASQAEALAHAMMGVEGSRVSSEASLTRTRLILASGLPPYWRVREVHAEILVSLGCTAEALLIYERLESWERVVDCYRRMGQMEKAESVLRKLLSDRPTDVDVICSLGDITRHKEYYEKAIEVSSDRCARARRSLGMHFLESRMHSEALTHFTRSLQLQPIQLGVWFNAGHCAWIEGRYQEAASAYHKCVSLEPEHFEAWNNLAAAYIRLDKKDRALRILHEALKIKFEDANVWENFLLLSIDTKETRSALLALERLIQLKEEKKENKKVGDDEVIEAIVAQIEATQMEKERRDLGELAAKTLAHLRATEPLTGRMWRAYARLRRDTGDIGKYMDLLQKARTAWTGDLSWIKSSEMVERVVEVAMEHEQTRLRAAEAKGDDAIKQAKNLARMSLRAVLAAIDRGEEVYAEEVNNAIARARELFKTVSE